MISTHKWGRRGGVVAFFGGVLVDVVFSRGFLRGIELGRSRRVPRVVGWRTFTWAPSCRRSGPRCARADPPLRDTGGLRKAETGTRGPPEASDLVS